MMSVEIVESHLDLKDFQSDVKPTWCPGCGDYGVLRGTLEAMKELQIPPRNIVVVSGIGCSSNFPHFLSSYGVHALHGRALPVGMGIQLANHELTTIVAGGDGDGYGIGAGHFVHACRRNVNITYIVMNNEIYGLTTGQASPTSREGLVTKSTPRDYSLHELPLNPIAVALAAGASFVARGFSGERTHLANLVEEGIKHRGFSYIDVISPCVTFQKMATYDFFKERVFKIEDNEYDTSDFGAAMAHAREPWEEKIAIGLFYQEDRPLYEDYEPTLRRGPLVSQKRNLRNQKKILKQFY
ncbi:MAG: 2-oxoacid:ferredoxin oxidoreductase subunit beta [Candidatus Heimdallarchaeota archaeon]